MPYQYITFAAEQGVATITLNRPDVLNSFNMPMAAELQDALQRAAEDDAIRAVLLTGAGRAFCAGQDLAEVAPGIAAIAAPPSAAPMDGSAGPEISEIVRESYNPLVRAIRGLEKPVVCAVNGVAAGAGANLALACDVVFAADTASFVQAFSKIGLIPDTGGTFFLPRLVGLARATALAFLGDKLPAAEAQAMGLIFRVVDAARLLDEARALARRLATQPTRGFGLTKRAFNQSLSNDLDAQLEVEAELQAEAARTADFAEGVRAFLEKRQPSFAGR
ncbi:MAG: 2-(1,2-epoxy-1,2-dihydrophenyl)acetyl-CoA isomerase PaaG [Gemmatimonadota bacterium]|nr:2-(1,2-epoxy-1,2-dihydrophenyl)acetyl-CoA isomerase PaaG [Gemmatimonadota bacterium]